MKGKIMFEVAKSEDGWFIASPKDGDLYVTTNGFIINMFQNHSLQKINEKMFTDGLYFKSEDEANRVLDLVNSYDFEDMKAFEMGVKLGRLIASSPVDSGRDGPNVVR